MRPRFIGDICLTLPTLDAVRRACPSARIGYLVEEACAPLLSSDPRIDDLIVSRRHGGAWDVVAAIHRLRPQLVLDLFCNPRTAIWTALSGATIRVGYPGKGWRSAAYTHHVRPRVLSAVDFHLASVARLGWPAETAAPRLHLEESARVEARQALAALGIPAASSALGLHPGARWPTRRWDPRRFAALGRRFLDQQPAGVVLVTGTAEESPLVEQVREELPRGRAFSIVGWPLARFVAMQSLCAAFVCGDTGPVHTAASAGVPTLGLMSRNRPAMFFPYRESDGHRAFYVRAECSPCHRDVCPDLRCLDRLTVEAAWALLSGMLARR
ncbi:MAG TPA: glycosyltransferase family 9 protein [Candidatus Eisenbacteria bacterium]|nr:glycosyltransferase family 9 protein [Candidatus Eisenbacteria bacterium]